MFKPTPCRRDTSRTLLERFWQTGVIMLKKLNKLPAVIISVIIAVLVSMITVLSCTASSEKTVKITSEKQAVDSVSVAGVKVDAYYGFTGQYHCAEFVMRFYKEVFGVTVNNLYSSYSTPTSSKGSFAVTKKPVVGDIVRFSDRTHWALVKEVKGDGTVVIAEQNWSYYSGGNKVCTVGRKISVNSSYTFFHYSGYDKKVKAYEKKQIEKRLTKVEDNDKLSELEKQAQFEKDVNEKLFFTKR